MYVSEKTLDKSCPICLNNSKETKNTFKIYFKINVNFGLPSTSVVFFNKEVASEMGLQSSTPLKTEVKHWQRVLQTS